MTNNKPQPNDDDMPPRPVPPSVFYRGRKPAPCRSFDQLNEEQARQRHKQAERNARQAEREDDDDD